MGPVFHRPPPGRSTHISRVDGPRPLAPPARLADEAAPAEGEGHDGRGETRDEDASPAGEGRPDHARRVLDPPCPGQGFLAEGPHHRPTCHPDEHPDGCLLYTS